MQWAELLLNVVGVGTLVMISYQIGRLGGALGGLADRVDTLEGWRNSLAAWPHTKT